MYLQSLLASHEKTEAEVKVYSTEIERLKAMSSKVIQGTSSSGRFVSVYSQACVTIVICP